MQARSYHNTTDLAGDELADATTAAATQEDLILTFYERNRGGLFTPSQVLDHLFFALRGAPITSVRRAISNLTRRGLLVKTETKREGRYGRAEYCWTYAKGAQLELL